MHVYVRIQPAWTFVEVRRAAIALAREVERRRPDLVTTAWWKEERGERVFVDFNQMARDRTIACAYSLRANARATVSTPVTWDELPDVEPDDFDLRTVPARFAEIGDPHAGIDDAAHDITPLLEWAERDDRRRPGRPAVPAGPPEDARRAEARAAQPRQAHPGQRLSRRAAWLLAAERSTQEPVEQVGRLVVSEQITRPAVDLYGLRLADLEPILVLSHGVLGGLVPAHPELAHSLL